MRQLLPAVLAVVVVAATVAAGTPVAPQRDTGVTADAPSSTAATEPVVARPNTTSYLAPADEARETSRFGNASLDVAGAAAMDTSAYRNRLTEAATLRAVETAPNDTVRTRRIRAAADELSNRTTAIQRRQTSAIREYNRGTISTSTFLREMAVTNARAVETRAAVDRILQSVDEQPGYSLPIELQTRLESLRAVPTLLQGPVRQRAGRAVSGQAPRTLIYTETTDAGVVLARTSEDRYVREVFLGNEYDPTGENEFTITSAFERARALYPWADQNRITTPSADGYGNTGVYRILVDHTQGRLVTYIDGATTNAFREIQQKRLDSLPVTNNVTAGDENITVTANLTHETGPAEVTVRDTVTGAPVDARIRLNEQFVGTTGADGRLWTIQPSGTTVLNATTAEGQSVEVTLFAG